MKRALAAILLTALLLCGCGAPADTPQVGAEDEVNTAVTPETPPHSETEAPPAPPKTEPAEPDPPPPEEETAPDPVETLLASLTLEEKVGQLFFPRCPAEAAAEDVQTYHLGGYILFGRDMKDADGNWLTKEQFTDTVQSYQSAALEDTGIPLLIGSDEEGGTVTRVSRNPNLFDSKFLSPQQLWDRQHEHGNIFSEDAWERSNALLALGINVNLSPVCDVSTDPNDFIYDRTLGRDAETTAETIRSVAGAMGAAGIGSVLKHFPGYGSNVDTHTGIAVDSRPLETFETADLLPFAAGMEAGGGTTAVLVSHNIVECFDANLPASLSPAVHRYLREEMSFDGVVMTDDLAMDAVSAYAGGGSVAVMALQAGNDLIITTDYRTQIPAVIAAVESGALDEAIIHNACRRVLRWKAELGLPGEE